MYVHTHILKHDNCLVACVFLLESNMHLIRIKEESLHCVDAHNHRRRKLCKIVVYSCGWIHVCTCLVMVGTKSTQIPNATTYHHFDFIYSVSTERCQEMCVTFKQYSIQFRQIDQHIIVQHAIESTTSANGISLSRATCIVRRSPPPPPPLPAAPPQRSAEHR